MLTTVAFIKALVGDGTAHESSPRAPPPLSQATEARMRRNAQGIARLRAGVQVAGFSATAEEAGKFARDYKVRHEKSRRRCRTAWIQEFSRMTSVTGRRTG
jgi:hypothetical protein